VSSEAGRDPYLIPFNGRLARRLLSRCVNRHSFFPPQLLVFFSTYWFGEGARHAIFARPRPPCPRRPEAHPQVLVLVCHRSVPGNSPPQVVRSSFVFLDFFDCSSMREDGESFSAPMQPVHGSGFSNNTFFVCTVLREGFS